jgi:hypothetical protein
VQILIVYRECEYLIAITKCWINKYGGLEIMPGCVIQKLLDKAVASNEDHSQELKAAQKALQKMDEFRGGSWNYPKLMHGGWNYFDLTTAG